MNARRFLIASALLVFVLAGSTGCASSETRGIGNEGFAVFDVEPSDAEVWLDGQLAGKAREFTGGSKVLLLQSGTHKIEIKKEGYAPFRKELYASSGVKQTVSARLQKVSQ